MMIYNGLYIDKQQRNGRRNGQHTGGRGFVQTSQATGWHAIMDNFLLVVNPGYFVYNIYELSNLPDV